MSNFFNAIKAGDISGMEAQLKENPWMLSVKHPQKGGATPTIAAVREGQMESLKWLVDNKSDLSVEDNFEWTALNWAKDADKDDFVKALEDMKCPMGSADEDEDSEEEEFNVNEMIAN